MRYILMILAAFAVAACAEHGGEEAGSSEHSGDAAENKGDEHGGAPAEEEGDEHGGEPAEEKGEEHGGEPAEEEGDEHDGEPAEEKGDEHGGDPAMNLAQSEHGGSAAEHGGEAAEEDGGEPADHDEGHGHDHEGENDEHGEEHGGDAAANVAGAERERFYAEDIKSAVEAYIAERSDDDGVFEIHDSKTDETLELRFVKVHDPVRRIDGETYFACTDFHVVGEEDKLYDLDFWMNPQTGELAVYDERIHKEPRKSFLYGWYKEPRYTFVNDQVVSLY